MWKDRPVQIQPLHQTDPITVHNYREFCDHAVNVLFRYIEEPAYNPSAFGKLVESLRLKPVKGGEFVMITLPLYCPIVSGGICVDLARLSGTIDDLQDFGIPVLP
jgi:hypothetical protein